MPSGMNRTCPTFAVRLGVSLTHGDKIREAQTFTVSYPAKHHALEKFMVTKTAARLKVDEEAEWDRFFGLIDPVYFPTVREIQMEQFVWPTTERAISQSLWVKWAEQILKNGIKVTEKAGTHWRPRLKGLRR
ncbi:hypothetical protein B0H19DRAFT_1269283 [Mycena capillaripes]|nr:hypothetical protein B0H19DRAFT_1269283 [Mycena capillaripes]